MAGMQSYVDTLAAARAAGLVTIADAKRNDVTATAEAYARAFLHPESEFSADALTISPYLGTDSMHPRTSDASTWGHVAFRRSAQSSPARMARRPSE
jgi:orotidine-5'-phosphate decarboxylase